MLKTLAAKHQSSVVKMAARHKAKVLTPHGLRTCFEARRPRTGKRELVARFGGIPLKRQRNASVNDRVPRHPRYQKKDLVTRLGRSECEICEKIGQVEVHQVRKLADLGVCNPNQPAWAALMAEKRRKTLIVCTACHEQIHRVG